MGSSSDAAGRPAGNLYAALLLAGLLVLAWVLWSGMFKPLLLGLGALSCTLTLYVAYRMGTFDTNPYSLRLTPRLFGFWAWLLREIVISSIAVARVVLSPQDKLDPQIVEVSAEELGLADLALLGNSITLTPGTLTLDAHEGRLLVHALNRGGARALLNGEMKRRVAALRRR